MPGFRRSGNKDSNSALQLGKAATSEVPDLLHAFFIFPHLVGHLQRLPAVLPQLAQVYMERSDGRKDDEWGNN